MGGLGSTAVNAEGFYDGTYCTFTWGNDQTGTITIKAGGTAPGDSAQCAAALGAAVEAGHYFSVHSEATGSGSNYMNDGATGADAMAIGPYAAASAPTSIALGANSLANTAAGQVGYDPATNAPSTNTTPTWVSTAGALSVGGGTVDGKLVTRQITNVAAGTGETDAVNVAQLKQAVLAGQGSWLIGNDPAQAAAAVGTVNSGDRVDFVSGDTGNTLVTVTDNGTDKSKVEIKAARSPLQYTGTNNADGSNTANQNQFTSTNYVTLVGGVAGPVTINNVAPAELSATSLQAVNGSQLYAVKQTAEMGWNLTAESANSSTVKPGNTVDLSNSDGNIVVAKTATSHNVTFDLAPILNIGSTPIKIDGTSGLISGLTNKTITYPEFANGAGKAATEEQLKATSGALTTLGFGLRDTAGFTINKPLGQFIDVVGLGTSPGTYTGANLKTAVVDGKLHIQMTDQPLFGDVSVNTAGAGTITGLTNTTLGAADFATVGRAATEEQLKLVQQYAGSGWNLTTAATGTGTVTGTSVEAVKPTETVTFTAGDNIAIKQDGKNVTIATNPDVTFNSVTANTVTVGPVSITSMGINAGDTKITGVADGTISQDSTDAVNGSQLWDLQQTAGAGWNLQANGGPTSNIAPGGNVNVVNGTNTTAVVQGNQLKINVVDNPTFNGPVTMNGGATVSNNLTVTNGTTVDMGGNKVTNVAPGTSGTDAVNLNQLNEATKGIPNIDGRLNDLDKEARAGTASGNSGSAASLYARQEPVGCSRQYVSWCHRSCDGRIYHHRQRQVGVQGQCEHQQQGSCRCNHWCRLSVVMPLHPAQPLGGI